MTSNNNNPSPTIEPPSPLSSTTSSPSPSSPTTTIDYLCVLDFEATCDEGKGKTPKPQEIIEFPTVLVDVRTKEILVEDVFYYYIRPDVHPQLSTFCTELTGITQQQMDNGAIPLMDAIQRHKEWLYKRNLVPFHRATKDAEVSTTTENNDNTNETKKTFVYVTCGEWDLNTCLPNQLAYHNKSVPSQFHTWINIKKECMKMYDHHHHEGGNASNVKPNDDNTRAKQGEKKKKKKTKQRIGFGMKRMLQDRGLDLEGRHHSGIDDSKNIARICQARLKDGWKPQLQ